MQCAESGIDPMAPRERGEACARGLVLSQDYHYLDDLHTVNTPRSPRRRARGANARTQPTDDPGTAGGARERHKVTPHARHGSPER